MKDIIKDIKIINVNNNLDRDDDAELIDALEKGIIQWKESKSKKYDHIQNKQYTCLKGYKNELAYLEFMEKKTKKHPLEKDNKKRPLENKTIKFSYYLVIKIALELTAEEVRAWGAVSRDYFRGSRISEMELMDEEEASKSELCGGTKELIHDGNVIRTRKFTDGQPKGSSPIARANTEFKSKRNDWIKKQHANLTKKKMPSDEAIEIIRIELRNQKLTNGIFGTWTSDDQESNPLILEFDTIKDVIYKKK